MPEDVIRDRFAWRFKLGRYLWINRSPTDPGLNFSFIKVLAFSLGKGTKTHGSVFAENKLKITGEKYSLA